MKRIALITLVMILAAGALAGCGANLRGNRVLGQLFSMGMQLPIRCFMSVGSVFMLQFCGGWDVVS